MTQQFYYLTAWLMAFGIALLAVVAWTVPTASYVASLLGVVLLLVCGYSLKKYLDALCETDKDPS